MTKISIIANCQGAPLSRILPYISSCTIEHVFVAHELSLDDEDRVCEALINSDIIFAQPFMSTFKISSLHAVNINKTLGGKAILAPNLHFEASFGEPTNLRKLDGQQLSDAPTSTYHYKPIVEAYFNGRNLKNAIQYLTDKDWYSSCQADKILLRSIENMKYREKLCDIEMCDSITDMLDIMPLFYAMNHPVDSLIYLLAEKFLTKAGIPFTNLNSDFFGTSQVCRALGSIALPANPSIAHHLKFSYPADLIYKGISNNGMVIREVTYTPEALVKAFFATYDAYGDNIVKEDIMKLSNSGQEIFRLD